MHESCIRIQEPHEFARIANNLEKKFANFYFLHRRTSVRIQEQHEFATIANNIEKENANFYLLHIAFI